MENAGKVQSIEKFVQDCADVYCGNIKKTDNADLLLKLSVVFKRIFPNESKEYFFRAFDLLKELRSYTLDFELISEIIFELESITVKIIRVFWHFMDKEDIIDDHKQYVLLSHALREGNTREPFLRGKKCIFFGFQHLTAIQIDLLKIMAIENDVAVVVLKYQYENSIETDWIRWISLDEKGENSKQHEEITTKTILFPKKRLAEYIHHFSSGSQGINIMLAKKNPGFNHYNELALEGISFRTQSDIFTPVVGEVFEDIGIRVQNQSLEVSFFEQFLKTNIDRAIREKKFRKIKVLTDLKRTCDKWTTLSKENKKITVLEVETFKRVIEHNLPKVYAQKITRKKGIHVFRDRRYSFGGHFKEKFIGSIIEL